ncbi:hypothetical protein TrST_g3117 [Triparma strigata]|uniref:Peroxisomal membrane protein 2 n=1 Tax=Triparma strigata TaxID=1606541 RepID=A0A9W7F3M8_9STRA|nr:hypothetical protein TrST_g3117 [Triparma strigata]
MHLLNAFFKNYPYLSSFIATGMKASLADAFAQKTEPVTSKRSPGKKFSVPRNLTFLLYGGLYQGCAQYYIYNRVFPFLFGAGSSPLQVTMKVVSDLLLVTPFLCLPSMYLMKAIVFQYSFKEAFRKYIYDIREHRVVKKYWAIWGPTQYLTFGFIPEHLRIVFIASVSFFWLIILSRLTAKSDKELKIK